MKINQIDPKKLSYTEDLQHIPTPPKELFVRGDLPKKRIKSVAIVGTRKPTAYGKEIAHNIASACAKSGIIVISGMALGIDSVAHKAAIESGGVTIAVLANGVDTFYPKSHTSLGYKIIETGGAVLSEYPNGTPAQPWQFLARNRIVSGLADAIVIVEAAEKSGTLSTANHALDQGKEVYAVPGNITSPLSSGCNNLIKNGAVPLLSPEELINYLLPNREQNQISLFKGENNEENLILDSLKNSPLNTEQLVKKSNIPIDTLNQTLTMLEIKGFIKNIDGNWSIN